MKDDRMLGTIVSKIVHNLVKHLISVSVSFPTHPKSITPILGCQASSSEQKFRKKINYKSNDKLG